MKKLLAMILAFTLGLTLLGCGATTTMFTTTASETTENTTSTEAVEPLSVMTPAGAPALAQLYIQNSDRYNVDVVVGPDPLIAALLSGSHDFVFAPTNVGAKLYTTGIDYQFLAAVTFGNYYLVSNQEDDFTIASLEGKEIIVFGQNATSDIILQYILEENGVNATLTYVDSVTTANSTYIADDTKIILTAEPSLSVLENAVPGFQYIDLQEEYSAITGSSSYPQAGVFGKTTLTDDQIEQFLADLEASINLVNDDVPAAIVLATEFEYGFSSAVLTTAIPNCHLDYVSALDVKTDLEAYFNIILDMNGVLIGGALPVNDFYYSED
ncbi:MAG: hypothetical protein JXB08_03560 [Bacilli bacterium]|nr:hypothetical protein [Bacilli bacterium]MBN2877163.1 hypothetical protein [Bacilli bacterium]